MTNNAAYDLVPAWSPDGSKIVFNSDRDGNLQIYKMNADGTGQTRLTSTIGGNFHPRWQPLLWVGGIAEAPDTTVAPSESSTPPYAGFAGIAAVGVVVLAAGGRFVRRRRAR